MEVIITGSRDGCSFVEEFLDKFHAATPITILTQGGASGVDTQAFEWALKNGVFFKCFMAEWGAYGPMAGPIRNYIMCDSAYYDAILIAFPGNKGTLNCMKCARERDIPIVMVKGLTSSMQPDGNRRRRR